MRLALLTLLALSPTLAAQEYIERFDYPDGTAIPGWTEHQGGDFQIQNKQLILTSGSHSYATIDKFLKIGDCVIDVECIYPAGSGVRYAGASARHDGSATENGLVQLKVQDNSSSGNWNRVFLYERPGSSLYLDMTPPSTRCVARLFVKGNQAWFHIDLDMDGYFELRSNVKTFASASTNADGRIGVTAYSNAIMDNWKFYNAQLSPATIGDQPKIGNTFDMVLSAPQNEVGGNKLPTPWIGWMSFKAGELPLPDGRGIPFDIFSSFQLWSGTIMPNTPVGKMSLPIPNDKNLIGARLFANAITVGAPGKFLTIGAISNPHGMEIQ
jgi:hypothetical protein